MARWEVVGRADTWNIHEGKRCIARVQKKVGARAEADNIADTHNALAGIEDPQAFVEAAKDAHAAISVMHLPRELDGGLFCNECGQVWPCRSRKAVRKFEPRAALGSGEGE